MATDYDWCHIHLYGVEGRKLVLLAYFLDNKKIGQRQRKFGSSQVLVKQKKGIEKKREACYSPVTLRLTRFLGQAEASGEQTETFTGNGEMIIRSRPAQGKII